jgi:beta-exotoxin I transport system permease protein
VSALTVDARRADPAVVPPSLRRSLMALVVQGLRDHRRSPLTWGGSLGAMCALMAFIWPSIENSMGELMKSYPASLKEAFGIQQLDSVEKYIDAEMLSLIIPLALAFFAVRCAVRATVSAEEQGHLDTLLSLPVSRRALVAATFIVTGSLLLAILAVVFALTMVAGTLAGTGMRAGTLALGLLNVWPLAMVVGGLAVLAAGVLHRSAPVTAIATACLGAMYVIDLGGKLAHELEPFRVVSAFRYYGSAVQNGFDVSHAIGLTLVAVVLAAIGAFLFERRDVL